MSLLIYDGALLLRRVCYLIERSKRGSLSDGEYGLKRFICRSSSTAVAQVLFIRWTKAGAPTETEMNVRVIPDFCLNEYGRRERNCWVS